MPVRSQAQSSFYDVRFADPSCLTGGTLQWWLAEHRDELVPAWIVEGWSGQGLRGRKAWSATVLTCVLLLRAEYAPMSRRETERRARHDITWRAAMGLAIGDRSPSDRTLRRFEKFLGKRHPETGRQRYELLHEHWVQLCLNHPGLAVGSTWAIDSTPMAAYGASLDTVRLLGDGLRDLVGKWARFTKTPLQQCADEWRAAFIMAKSTKGAFSIDWKNRAARQQVVDEVAAAVVRVVSAIRRRLDTVTRRSSRKKLLLRCRRLIKVITDDLEQSAEGRWSIRRGTAPDRIVSFTDPQARHSRKTVSVRFKGFKVHVLGELDSGVIAAVGVTPANVHDAKIAPRLVRRARALTDRLTQLLGDTAYGSAALRYRLRVAHQVRVLAPPPPVTTPSTTFRKELFEVDFEQKVAICPAGVESRDVSTWTSNGSPFLAYQWPKRTCDRCSLSAECRGKSTEKRRLLLHPHERDLREAQDEWNDPVTRDKYRRRTEVERLVHEVTRRGGRRASNWGLPSARLQAHLIAGASNLALLARAEAREHPQPLAA